MNIKYRVIIKVSYLAAWFEFDSAEEACGFATNAISHMEDSEDTKKNATIAIQVVDADAKDDDED